MPIQTNMNMYPYFPSFFHERKHSVAYSFSFTTVLHVAFNFKNTLCSSFRNSKSLIYSLCSCALCFIIWTSCHLTSSDWWLLDLLSIFCCYRNAAVNKRVHIPMNISTGQIYRSRITGSQDKWFCNLNRCNQVTFHKVYSNLYCN